MARQLMMEERDRIAQLHHRGFLQNQIAEALGRDPGTISRELARNRVDGEYFAAQAHDLARAAANDRWPASSTIPNSTPKCGAA